MYQEELDQVPLQHKTKATRKRVFTYTGTRGLGYGFIFSGKSCTADLQNPRVIHSGDLIFTLDDDTS